MIEGHWYAVSYAQFARLLDFGRKDASCARIHMALNLDARKIKFMYLRSKRERKRERVLVRPHACFPSMLISSIFLKGR
jgi:hypothetical protein